MSTESDASNIISLFGGAMYAHLPASFEDISVIREVPDHQEVYVDRNSEMSLIIELLAYEESISDDKASAHYFQDLATFNEASNSTVCVTESIKDPNFVPNLPTKCTRCVLIGYQTVAKEKSDSEKSTKTKNNVQIIMVLLRIPDVGTDVLITLNNPSPTKVLEYPAKCLCNVSSNISQNNSAAATMPSINIMKKVVNSLQINDWSLFV